MRKIFYIFMLFALMTGACYGSENINIIASIFPVYDWTREITKGADVNISLLLDSGIDLHSYNPSVNDMIKIAKSDVFIYVGGESDKWVHDALRNVTNRKQIAINLLEVLGANAKPEEELEGMQANHEHNHDLEHEHEHEHEQEHEHDHEHAHEHEHEQEHEHELEREHEHEHEHEQEHELELDEHIWLSLRNAEIICRNISEKLIAIDPEHEEIYRLNTLSYIQKLSELDGQYQELINSSARKILLFGDRFPFRYLADDYGLKCYAAFSGCSAETEASFETVKFLAEKVNELELNCVITIEGTRHKIAQTIIANSEAKNQKILVLNSMQSVIQGNSSYLSIMRANLEILKAALN